MNKILYRLFEQKIARMGIGSVPIRAIGGLRIDWRTVGVARLPIIARDAVGGESKATLKSHTVYIWISFRSLSRWSGNPQDAGTYLSCSAFT